MSTEKNSMPHNFGSRLRELRKAKKLSQHDFAASIGISQAFLSHLEVGRNQPTADILNSITSSYGVSTHWLLTGDGSMEGLADPHAEYRVSTVHRALTPEEEKLLEALLDYPEAREAMETFLQLPRSKQMKRLGDMLADLEEIKDPKGSGG